MSNKIIFMNEPLFWPIIAGAVLLMAIFFWKEVVISWKRRLIIKTLFIILAIGSLVLIALKPLITTGKVEGKIALITPGYDTRQLDSLKRENPGLKVTEYSALRPVLDDIHEAEVVYLLGYGIKSYDFPRVENIPINFLPQNSPEGVVKVKYSEQLNLGDNLKLQGLYKNPPSGNRLILEGPGGARLDSLTLTNEREQGLQLTTELKAPGNFVYYLVELNNESEVLSREPVPVQVDDKKSLRVLIYNNFPTFETKYLKNFLAEAGHEVVVRSQLTRGKFKNEYFNTPPVNIGNLSREALEAFDLLIIDAVSMRGISGSQLIELQNAVREDGLGVFIQPDDVFFRSPVIGTLKFERQTNNNLSLKGYQGVKFSGYPFVFDSSRDLESIHRDGDFVISGYIRYGRGRFGSTVLSNTWHLVLEGNTEVYRKVWSGLVSQLSKREDVAFQIEHQDQFIFPHEPYPFKIRSQIPIPIVSNDSGGIIPLKQHVNFPDQWESTIWAGEVGWASIKLDTIETENFYVAEEGSWNSLISQKTLEENRRHFAKSVSEKEGNLPLEPINPLWFYGLFLFAMGGLWLEPKLA